jgi:hypothetical protein
MLGWQIRRVDEYAWSPGPVAAWRPGHCHEPIWSAEQVDVVDHGSSLVTRGGAWSHCQQLGRCLEQLITITLAQHLSGHFGARIEAIPHLDERPRPGQLPDLGRALPGCLELGRGPDTG